MLAEIRCYEDFFHVLRARAAELNITREGIDFIAGLPSGYSGKLLGERQVKRVGSISFDPILGALAIKLVAVPDDEAMARIASRLVDHRAKCRTSTAQKLISIEEEVERRACEIVEQRDARQARRQVRKMRLLSHRRLAAMTKEERAEVSRKAGKARWAGWSPRKRRNHIAKMNAARAAKQRDANP